MIFRVLLLHAAVFCYAHDNIDAVQRSLVASHDMGGKTSVFVNGSQQIRRTTARCSDLAWSGKKWGNDAKGIDVSAWTNNELSFIGVYKLSSYGGNWYCNDLSDGIEFGSTPDGVSTYQTVRAILGPTPSSSLSCCSSSKPNGACNAMDKEASVQQLCKQLGYSVGTLVKKVSTNSCPEIEWMGGKWSSDFVSSAGNGQQFKCSGATKKCTCEHGTEATGDACPSNEANFCSKCDDGFHIVDGSCVENKCNCVNGNATTGTRCPRAGDDSCETCDNGFHPSNDNKACIENQCQCEHGTGPKGIACAQHGRVVCTSCNDAHYLDGTSCKAKMSCTDAEQGFVAHGAAITQSDNKYAKSCAVDTPQVLTSGFCEKNMCFVDPDRKHCCRTNKCTCSKGTATVAGSEDERMLCETDGTEDCSACDAGYHLTADAGLGSQTCVANVCTCKNGIAAVNTGSMGTLCAVDGKEDCSSCHPGYHISEPADIGLQTCVPNVCTCSGGVPSVATGSGGTLCKADNSHDCSSCHVGYTISAPPDENLQSCEPNQCNDNKLPAGPAYDLSDCDREIRTGRSCAIGCADGYSGADETYTCLSSGELDGKPPSCEAQKCNQKNGSQMFTSHITTSNCTNAATTDTCTATCNNGYSGTSQTYTCDHDGFSGKAMHCEPNPCDASHAVVNGQPGDCTSTLDSGAHCTITCNEGYTRTGVTDCLAGTLRAVATCEPNPCDASEPPKYGTKGDCTSDLKSGGTCQPTCGDGYTVSGPSTCEKGVLTAATCKAALVCELVYEKNCEETFGYWSDDEQHLDYPGCENFCNTMYLAHGKTVKGCELAAVASAERNAKGAWCFAHGHRCAMGEATNNAAARCVPLVEMD